MARGVSTGASSSVPTSDQVPELMNAVPSRAVMAATADAVSCEADAMTGVPASAPLPAATSARMGPMIDPGFHNRRGEARRQIQALHQVGRPGSRARIHQLRRRGVGVLAARLRPSASN